jgi:hypothetical protein
LLADAMALDAVSDDALRALIAEGEASGQRLLGMQRPFETKCADASVSRLSQSARGGAWRRRPINAILWI